MSAAGSSSVSRGTASSPSSGSSSRRCSPAPAAPIAGFWSAGIEFEDLARSVRQDGIEPTLEKLHDKGVYVTLEEFKGRRAIERGGMRRPAHPKDFDNPLLSRHFEARTGGSRGVGTRVLVDLDLLEHEAAYYSIFHSAFGVNGRPEALWFPPPPAVAGMKQALRRAKLGAPPTRWFSQSRPELTRATARSAVFTRYTIYMSRLLGRRLRAPQFVPPDRASVVAEWLAAQRQQGCPGVLGAGASSAARVCAAARERGLDISGTFFRISGEPYTAAKARIIADSGCTAASHYSMAEIGIIGVGCAAPIAVDDVHLLTDKVAVIQRDRPSAPAESRSVPSSTRRSCRAVRSSCSTWRAMITARSWHGTAAARSVRSGSSAISTPFAATTS